MSITKVGKLFWPWSAVLGLLFSAVFLAGCATDDSSFADITGATPGTNNTAALASGNGGDTLHVGDPLLITFSDMPNPPPPASVRIGEDGTITLIWNQT